MKNNENSMFDDLLDAPIVEQEEQDIEPMSVQNIITENETEQTEESEILEEPSNDEFEEVTELSDNPVFAFLQSKGIKDPSKIQFSNEDGEIEEIDFNTLTSQEQFELLQEISDPGLSQDEIDAINYLRRHRMSLGTVMNTYAQQKLDEYLNEHPEDRHQKVYTIDDYSDDDLYIVDLKRRYPDFTDDEILSKLNEAKNNEDLYKKETEILRNTYKAQEDKAEADRIASEQQQITDLRNNLMEAARNFNEIALDYTDEQSDSLVIEDGDKQQMISYILDQDANGKSQLVKDLEDPDALLELAWLRTQGAEVLSSVTKYWKETLATERAENKKLKAQIEKLNKKGNSTVVSQTPPQKQVSNNNGVYSAWDNSGLL